MRKKILQPSQSKILEYIKENESLKQELDKVTREKNDLSLKVDLLTAAVNHLDKAWKEEFHPMTLAFAKQMTIELKANEHKGDWNEWRDVKEMSYELEWHKAKLLHAMRDNEKDKVKEYIADCGNILMFMGNAGGLYDKDIK